jgi:hypothetical protein
MSNHDFRSILEKLTLLEGDLTPTNVKHGLNKQQKSVKQMPALFKPKTQKILGGDPNAKNPMSGYMVGADESEEMDEEIIDEWQNSAPGEEEQYDLEMVKEAKKVEEEASEDVLSKVKNSFTDYLKGLEDSIKTDKDLIDKKKQDLDLKKKELKDLTLQAKKKQEEQKELDEDHVKLEIDDRICVTGPNEFQGEFGNVLEFAPSRNFVVVKLDNGEEASMHISDVEFHDDQEDVEDWEDDIVEDPTQEEPSGATATAELINPTYGESESNPVKTFEVDATNLLEIHGDEVNGFEIKRGDRSLPTRFNKLSDAEMALDMFKARMAAKKEQDLNSDYLEEK